MKRRCRQLLGDKRGAAAVELALVAGPLFALLFAVFEVGWDWYCLTSLDSATQAAARKIMTGNVQGMTVSGQQLSAAQFRTNVLCPLLPSTFNCSNVIVNVKTFAEDVYPSGYYSLLNGNQTGLNLPPLDNTQTSYCIGSSGAYVLLQVLYPLPLLTNVFMNLPLTTFNGTKSLLLISNATFRNEPFPPGSFQSPNGC